MNKEISRAISITGGPAALAAKLSDHMSLSKPLTPMAVRQWVTRGVPAEYCIPIEQVCVDLVFRHQLRPDLYPPCDYNFLSGGS